MQYFPPALETLVEQFAKLPGVGVKSAQRLAFYVLSMSEEDANAFAQAILSAKTAIHCCPVCQNLTEGDGPCSICSSPRRDSSTICVVADPKDVVAMERSREYPGLYHVLHGVISPMNHVGPDDIRVKELVDRVAKGGVAEVIMATTSLGSATTQITDVSRLASWQMGHSPSPSEKFWHTGQQWMEALALTMASAKAAASSSGRERTKKASRWAVLRPMPGRRANCSTSCSSAGGKYCIGENIPS